MALGLLFRRATFFNLQVSGQILVLLVQCLNMRCRAFKNRLFSKLTELIEAVEAENKAKIESKWPLITNSHYVLYHLIQH